ncbi:MAG: hypothetical protein QXD62_00045 [Candidatus Woesearchaeota archaeon]
MKIKKSIASLLEERLRESSFLEVSRSLLQIIAEMPQKNYLSSYHFFKSQSKNSYKKENAIKKQFISYLRNRLSSDFEYPGIGVVYEFIDRMQKFRKENVLFNSSIEGCIYNLFIKKPEEALTLLIKSFYDGSKKYEKLKEVRKQEQPSHLAKEYNSILKVLMSLCD